jgi:hypothetical protein
METYGMISSFSPLRKRIGTSVILGRISSLGQYWWHILVMNFAAGKMLNNVVRCDMPCSLYEWIYAWGHTLGSTS